MLSNSSSAPFVNASSIARCSRRVSSPIASSSNSLRFSFSLYSPPGGRNGSSCVLNILRMKKIKSMAELVEDKEPVCKSGRQEMILDKLGYSRTFADVEEEVAELLSGIKKEAEAGRLPSNAATGLMELYKNYKNAVLKSGNPRAEKIVISNMATAFDLIMKDVEVSFDFPSYHKAIREPFDYYKFGQNYIRPLIDFRKSYVGNISVFSDIEDKLQQGHNVVLISNHQTEADPAIIALSLETTNRHISENLIYVAGDRVLSDPLCKPFSMGRNLFCVYSKKHMNDDPELAETKRKANTRTLKEMATTFRGGSQIVWIAPSGGRDRPDPSTGEWFPAPFDASSVDNMRRLAEHSGVPVHIYPMALIGYDIMPPPLQVEKEIGEQRVISFHGTGISVAPELNFKDITAGCENPEEAKTVYSDTLYRSVTEQYSVLRSAIHGNQGLKASSSTVSLSQPWRT